MSLLILVSVLWAFSFGLIKIELVGLDASFVAFVRLAISALVFLPFLKPACARGSVRWLMALGAVQYGLMYVLYIHAYRFLAAHEVALMTALTPLHVVLVEMVWQRRGRMAPLLAALLAVAGALVIVWHDAALPSAWTGVVLVQGANLCFALGQVTYRRRARALDLAHLSVFAWAYVGAALLAGVAAAFSTAGQLPDLSGRQMATLVYLGLIPSGLGFFLWNLGATRVGVGTLAVLNNVKVPLAVVASLLLFGERADPTRLLLGALLLGLALLVGHRRGEAVSTV